MTFKLEAVSRFRITLHNSEGEVKRISTSTRRSASSILSPVGILVTDFRNLTTLCPVYIVLNFIE
jgi:hypothetical protein